MLPRVLCLIQWSDFPNAAVECLTKRCCCYPGSAGKLESVYWLSSSFMHIFSLVIQQSYWGETTIRAVCREMVLSVGVMWVSCRCHVAVTFPVRSRLFGKKQPTHGIYLPLTLTSMCCSYVAFKHTQLIGDENLHACSEMWWRRPLPGNPPAKVHSHLHSG